MARKIKQYPILINTLSREFAVGAVTGDPETEEKAKQFMASFEAMLEQNPELASWMAEFEAKRDSRES